MTRDLFFPRKSGLAARTAVGAWIALRIVGCLGGATVIAGEAQDGKLARLGFAYDEQAHAAAAARTRQQRDSAGTDAPPDGVVRLPKYVVSGERVPLAEHEVLTPKGRLETAKKRYLNVGYQKTLGQVAAVATFINNPLGGWAPNGPEAMALYWDDERKRRNGELRDLGDLMALSDSLKPPEAPTPKGKEPKNK